MHVAIGFIAAMIFVSPALADNSARHDRSVEMAAAKRAAEKIGELRGSIDPAETADAFFKEVKPVPLGFGLPHDANPGTKNYPPPVSFHFEFMDLASAKRWQ